MKIRHILMVGALVPFVGCGSVDSGNDTDASGEEVTSDELLAVLPTSQMLLLTYPGLSTQEKMGLEKQSIAQASCEASSSEETAQFYQSGCSVASFVNGVVNDVLGMVANITSHTPSHVGDSSYAWGPYDTDDGATVVFYMQRNEDGTYGYRLQGKVTGNDDSSYLTLIEGEIEEGESVSQNVGAFGISYDNIHAVYPEKSVAGRASYEYDRLGTQTGVTATMESVLSSDGATHNIKVDYDVNDDSSGDLQYGFTDDLYQPDDQETDTTAQETAKVNTRWLSTGAGRSDVTVTGGDLGEATVYMTECWDQSYLAVYDARYFDGNSTYYQEGDSSQCVFEEPVFL